MTDTQISVGMNVDGVVTGTEKAKRKISELGGAAREAGKGTGAIGDGMAGAATKVEAATKNMVGSIQRQIAALEAGDKSSRQYQESLARMRGIDVAALRPYLDQLDAVKLRQAEAAKTAESFASSLGTMRMAGLAVAAAGGAVALFAKSIIDAADGLNDMSQRVGISVRELGKYQLAAEQSGASLESISKGVKGLSDNMIKHGDALRKAGVDATTADGAMQQLADVFADMPDGIEKTALATKLFGKAGMDLIPMLNLGSEGLRDAAIASADYAEQMAIMAPLADALNDSMAEIALSSKTAGAVMVNEFLPTLNAIALALLDSKDNATGFASVAGGTVKTVLQTLALVTSDVVFVLNGMGREIGAIAAQVAALGRLDFKGFTAIGDAVKEDAARARKELDQWQSDLVNGVANANAAVQSAYNKRQGFGEKSGARGYGLLGDLGGDSAAKKAIADQNKELEQQTKILAELSGYTGDYEASQQRLAEMLKSGKLDQESYTRAVSELVAKQPGMAAAKKAEAEAQKEIAKLQADYAASLQKSVIAGDEELAKAQAAYDAHGKLASVLQEELLARMEITREQIAGGAGSEAELSAIDAQIKAKRELVKVLRSGEVRDASEQSAKDAEAEWEKYADQIGQSLTDQLMEGGKSGAEYIEGLFRSMVLRPVIQALVTPIAQSVSSSIMSGGGGGGASGFNIFNSTSGLGDGLSVTLGKTASTLINNGYQQSGEALAGMAKAANNYSSQITKAGNALSYFSAAQSLADGKYGAAAGQAIGTYFGGPIGGSIGNAIGSAIDEAFGGGGGPKSDSSYNMGGFGDASATGLAGTYATGVEDAWKTLAKELEITTALKVGALTSIDTQGDAKTILRANATVDGVGVYDRATRMGTAENVGRSQEELQAAMAEETTRILFAALKASDLPEQYKTYLSTIGDSVADMTEAMTIVAVVDDFNDALQSLPFENLKTLSFEAAKGLIEVAGGMDVLGANLGTYYTNFYSAEEQRLQTIKTINAATAGSGLDAATATREQFRQIVEAQDLTTESGRATYAALLSVSGAFAGLTPVIEATTSKLLEMLGTTAKNALSGLEQSVEAEKATLQTAYDAQLERYTTQLDAVTESVGKLKSLSDSLKSTLDGMRISGSDTAYRAAAQAQISAALATARTGGGLPLDGQLTSALATVSKPSEQLFSTFEDYARDFYKTANDIGALSDLTAVQLSADEAMQVILKSQLTALEDGFKRQTNALDDILKNAEKQLDAALGLDTTMQSVADAIAGLAGVIGALGAATKADQTQKLGSTIEQYAGNYAASVNPAYADSAADTVYASSREAQIASLYASNLGRAADAGGLSYWTGSGLSVSEIEANIKGSAESAARAVSVATQNQFMELVNQSLGIANPIKAFAIGTNYVPRDMTAQIHEGERIIPAADNRELMARLQNPQQNNDALVTEIRALRQEVASLKASNEATAANTKKFASQFETASEGGRALLTEVYA